MIHQLTGLITERLTGKAQRLYCCVLCFALFIVFQRAFTCGAVVRPAVSDTTQPIFIKIKPSKTVVFKGEPFTVSYLLYYATNITDPGNEPDIKFQNCYVEEYPDKAAVPDERINNRLYHVVLLKKFLVIPQTEGVLKAPTVRVSLKVSLPASPEDFFGNDKTEIKKIPAKAMYIQVMPLPAKTDTAQFSGAVGNFKISCSFEPSQKFSNLLKVHLNIKGTGNLRFSNLSIPVLPPGIDYTELPNTEKDSLTGEGVQTEHTFSFQLFCNYRGKFILAPISFTYFSPDQKRYIKYLSPAYTWQVNTGKPMPKSLTAGKSLKIQADPVIYTKMYLGDATGNKLFFRSAFFFIALSFFRACYIC